MMELIKAPNPMLETPVEKFDFVNLNPKAIEAQMIELMLKNNGLGLAANQVGLNARVFVMKPQKLRLPPFAVFDPVIEGLSNEKDIAPEGCLSYPGLVLNVKRPISVMLRFFNSDQEEKRLKLDEIDARIALHEYDHLFGVNFVDRVSKLKFDIAMRKMKKRMKYGRTEHTTTGSF
jgi:peptide deformylase